MAEGTRARPSSSLYKVLIVATNAREQETLLQSAMAIANTHHGAIRLLTITDTGELPPWLRVVVDVGSAGLRVRYAPGGIVMDRINDGDQVIALDGPVTVDESVWYRVLSPIDHLEGWMGGEYLSLSP